jgi:hypothetical protein
MLPTPCQQLVARADCGADLLGVASGGDDSVAGGQGCLAMSTPIPRPAPVISQIFFELTLCSFTSLTTGLLWTC